jgi:putative transposase
MLQCDGKADRRWYIIDETYIKVQGHWCQLYRVVDCDGHLVGSLRSILAPLGRPGQNFQVRPDVTRAPESVTFGPI